MARAGAPESFGGYPSLPQRETSEEALRLQSEVVESWVSLQLQTANGGPERCLFGSMNIEAEIDRVEVREDVPAKDIEVPTEAAQFSSDRICLRDQLAGKIAPNTRDF